MIRINRHLALDESEVSFSYIRAGGPGGQNVNKVSSAAQLRFDAKASPSLPGAVKERLCAIAGTAMTKAGVIVITARRHRSQETNREEALERLLDLIRKASVVPKVRRPTRPSAAARRRRIEGKERRGGVKRMRSRVSGED
jgi:ribosome-associated protein